MKKAGWIIVSITSFCIGLYPVTYFLVDRKFGLLSSKSEALLLNTPWNIGFYAHIVFGGIALFIGWIQFNQSLRFSRLMLHRTIGKIYVISALVSSLAGIYIGFFATGGVISSTGFIGLGVTWFATTLLAYQNIRHQRLSAHQKWMTYSYAACFAAVTLRIWLPILTSLTHDFLTSYKIVAWLCWVPNLIVAYFLNIRRPDLQKNLH